MVSVPIQNLDVSTRSHAKIQPPVGVDVRYDIISDINAHGSVRQGCFSGPVVFKLNLFLFSNHTQLEILHG